jgi:hypothetical protein
MRRGPWHQCGDRSQKLALEQIQNGVGVGVVISPRDLGHDNAIDYATQYHALGAHVMIDQQFYTPDSMIGKLDTYPICRHRNSISSLHSISDHDLGELARDLENVNRAMAADGVLAPAVVYEAGRPEIHALNGRLHRAARDVGNALGKPAYATVVLGRSATATMDTVNAALSFATTLDADGYYFAFEFDPERIPSSREAVGRCLSAGLTLACTGKPVFHAYAGPLGLLSFGFGATGIGIGHSQNLWKFDRSRWDDADAQGGGGNAPARYFSSALWGTIIHPDESAQLSTAIQGQILTPSPFTIPWDRWQANKHMVYCLGTTIAGMAGTTDPRMNVQAAINILDAAAALHTTISGTLALKDFTNTYQRNWRLALTDLLANNSADFDYFALLMQ